MLDPRGLYEGIGIGVAFCAAMGLLATLHTVWRVVESDDGEDREHDSRRFFVLFSALSLLYNSLLMLIAAGVYIGRPIPWWLFLGFLLLPWIYTGWLGRLWLHPRFGMALGAATGIGNVGMVLPSFLLLPVWGPFALWMAA